MERGSPANVRLFPRRGARADLDQAAPDPLSRVQSLGARHGRPERCLGGPPRPEPQGWQRDSGRRQVGTRPYRRPDPGGEPGDHRRDSHLGALQGSGRERQGLRDLPPRHEGPRLELERGCPEDQGLRGARDPGHAFFGVLSTRGRRGREARARASHGARVRPRRGRRLARAQGRISLLRDGRHHRPLRPVRKADGLRQGDSRHHGTAAGTPAPARPRAREIGFPEPRRARAAQSVDGAARIPVDVP